MVYIIASILASTSILVLFRWMQHSQAITRHAIVVGYLTSALAGAVLFEVDWKFISHHWFWYAAMEGAAFYFVFRMMALTTAQVGITVASIATKMSVVIPTFIGIAALGESISWYKIAGLLFRLVSVILAAGTSVTVKRWILPLMVFACTGLLVDRHHLKSCSCQTDADSQRCAKQKPQVRFPKCLTHINGC